MERGQPGGDMQMERGQPGGDMQMGGLLSTTGHVFIGLKQEQFRGVLALFPLINRCRRQSLNQRERRSCSRARAVSTRRSPV